MSCQSAPKSSGDRDPIIGLNALLSHRYTAEPNTKPQRSREEKEEKEKLSYATHSFDLDRVDEGRKIVNKVSKKITFAFARDV